jgi:hypothetical protein
MIKVASKGRSASPRMYKGAQSKPDSNQQEEEVLNSVTPIKCCIYDQKSTRRTGVVAGRLE